MENCSQPNCGTVSRIQLKIVITQYWVVVSSSYLEANMGTTPQRVEHKMVSMATPVARGTRSLHFNIEYYKN